MSAERERGGRRALARLSRVLGTGAIALIMTASAVAVDPIPDAARATTTEGDGGISIALVAAPAATGVVRPGQPLSVRVTVTNTGTEPTGAISLELAVDGARSAGATALADWLDGLTPDSATVPVATATVSSLERGASAVLDLIVPDESAAMSGEFGARLASVRAVVDEVELAVDRTALVWVPEGTTPPVASTTFVAAIATPGEAAGLLGADILARYTAEAGALTRTLDAVAGRPVLLGIDPRVIASIRFLGTQAPATATAFLDRLLLAPNESFLLPWADADPLSTITAVGTALPPPEGTGIAPAAGADDGTTPSPSPSPEQEATLAELAAWPVSLSGVTWAETGTLTTDAIPVLASTNTGVLIAPGSSLESRAAVQALDGMRVVRVDDALSMAAREASLAVSQQRFDRAMARVSALLAATAESEPGVPAVIPLNRDQLAGTDRLVDTIAQTVALPWSNGAEVSDALALTPADGAVVDSGIDESRAVAVQDALAAEAADREFATIAVTPSVITDVRRLELLAALSLGWGDESTASLERFEVDSATLRSSVQVVESSAITLLADRASLPVTVQNDLAVAVRVFVRVEPDTAQLRVVDSRIETLVEPLSQTRALVPVESLTNGQVDITVTVRDAESRTIGEATRVSLNLQAGWETVGTIAVAIALLLLLVVGITRDVRKRRKRRREDQS